MKDMKPEDFIIRPESASASCKGCYFNRSISKLCEITLEFRRKLDKELGNCVKNRTIYQRKKDIPMILYITDRGDRSVGIMPQTWKVECPFLATETDQEQLDWFRDAILKTYQEYAEGRLTGEYEGERDEPEID